MGVEKLESNDDVVIWKGINKTVIDEMYKVIKQKNKMFIIFAIKEEYLLYDELEKINSNYLIMFEDMGDVFISNYVKRFKEMKKEWKVVSGINRGKLNFSEKISDIEYVDEVLSELEDYVHGDINERVTIARQKLNNCSSQLKEKSSQLNHLIKVSQTPKGNQIIDILMKFKNE